MFMKKTIQNPFLWSTIILASVVIILFLKCFNFIDTPFVLIGVDDPEYRQYMELYRPIDEMRTSQIHCTSPEQALEIATTYADGAIFEDIDRTTDILIAHDADNNLFFILFEEKNRPAYMSRVVIDAYTGAIIEVAQIK